MTWDPERILGEGLVWYVAPSHPQDKQAGCDSGRGEGILVFLYLDSESEQN